MNARPTSRIVTSMAMDFAVEVDGLDDDGARDAIDAFHADLEWSNAVFSLWDPESTLSRLSRGDLVLDECPGEVREVLAACEFYREVSAGGFDARRSDGVIDPTGLVKGWAVARAIRHFEAAGATDWFVGGAGDIVCAPGGRPRRIGIADPRVHGDPAGTDVVDAVVLTGDLRALATSGGANHEAHLWDPDTGKAAAHFLQVSVVGPDLVECDVFATAIAGGGQRAVAPALERGMEVLIVTHQREDGTFGAQSSPGWPSPEPGL